MSCIPVIEVDEEKFLDNVDYYIDQVINGLETVIILTDNGKILFQAVD